MRVVQGGLDTLARHGLPGSFFVEMLCAGHFGHESLRTVVQRIEAAGRHEIELHLHPEWAYLEDENWRERVIGRRREGWRPQPHLARYSAEAFEPLLERACAHFAAVVGRPPRAFRAGNLSMAGHLYPVLARHGITVSSSVGLGALVPDEPHLQICRGGLSIGGVTEWPVTTFDDIPFGPRHHWRLLTVTGSTFGELRRVLDLALRRGGGPIVILTHASEYSAEVRGSHPPRFRSNPITMQRIEALCLYLASQRDRFLVSTFSDCALEPDCQLPRPPLRIGPWAAGRRWWEARRSAHLGAM